MKFGLRTPSLNKRIAARTSIKRYVRHTMGLKVPRGYGFLTNPKRAFYNRIYTRTTFSIDKLVLLAIRQNHVRMSKNNYSYTQSLPAENESNLIKSADVASYAHSSSDKLLEEIKEKNALPEYHVLFIIFASIFYLLLAPHVPAWLSIILLVLIIVAFRYILGWDRERKTVSLTYEIDTDAKKSYDKINQAFETLSSCDALWNITQQQETADWKRNAGATNLIKRNPLPIKQKLPKYFVSNIQPNTISIFSQTFYFFPDRILVFQKKDVGAINYADLKFDVSDTTFIETDRVPNDAEIVGYTWAYVNKDGGPDKRFKNNPQHSKVKYAEIRITTHSGVNIIIQCSNPKIAREFVNHLTIPKKTNSV